MNRCQCLSGLTVIYLNFNLQGGPRDSEDEFLWYFLTNNDNECPCLIPNNYYCVFFYFFRMSIWNYVYRNSPLSPQQKQKKVPVILVDFRLAGFLRRHCNNSLNMKTRRKSIMMVKVKGRKRGNKRKRRRTNQKNFPPLPRSECWATAGILLVQRSTMQSKALNHGPHQCLRSPLGMLLGWPRFFIPTPCLSI